MMNLSWETVCNSKEDKHIGFYLLSEYFVSVNEVTVVACELCEEKNLSLALYPRHLSKNGKG